MNILLVCNKFPYPPRDGGSLATYNMARGLVEAGNCLDLLAMNTSKHYSADVSSIDIKGLNKVRDVFIDNTYSYAGLLNNLLFSSMSYNAEQFVNREFEMVLSGMLREKHYDFVQLEGLYLSPYIQAIREGSEAGIIYRAHNIEHVIWRSYSRRVNKLKRLYFINQEKKIRILEKGIINKYDLLATFTETDLEILNALGNDRPSIVAPFGIYPDEFPAGKVSVNQGLHLQYIGALDWMPNIESLDWFIDNVWLRVKKKYPDLRFFVAGRNAKNEFVKKMIGKGIDFVGEVESSKEYLSNEGIVIVPLFSGSGIRVRIIEALSMKKPIIATSLAVAGIPVENGVNILIADTSDTFIEHIDKLLSNRHYADTLGESGGELSSRVFNNRIIAEELTLFYKNHCL
jgi:polysaccharide biosynthesis protein PslH